MYNKIFLPVFLSDDSQESIADNGADSHSGVCLSLLLFSPIVKDS